MFAIPPSDAGFPTIGSLDGSLPTYFPINELQMVPPMAGACAGSEISMPSPALTNAPSLSSGASTHTRTSPNRGSHSPPYGSISASSDLELNNEMHDPESMGDAVDDEDESDWPDLVEDCERMHFICYGVGGEDSLRPEQEQLRPLLNRFTMLERHQSRVEYRLNAQTAGCARDILPPRTTCDHLVEAYFTTFESVLRILHVPSFSREYERFWRNPMTSGSIETDDSMACKLMVIMALGSTVVLSLHGNGGPAEDRAYLQKAVPLWISYSKQWLTRRMPSAQRSDLNIAQIICLLALVRHVHADDGASSAALVQPGDYDLARIGTQMMLHRDPCQRNPKMPKKEVEIRRRLWATMVELSLQRSLDEDLPATLLPESFDCLPPSDVSDEELEADGPGDSTQTRDLTPSTILVLLSRTQRLRLKCVHLINSPAAPKTYQDAHNLASELASACSRNIEVLQSLRTPPSDFQIQLLQTYTRQFVRALHEPFTNHPTSGHYSRKVQLEVAARTLGYPPSLALTPTADAERMMDARPQATLTEGRADACVALRVFAQGYVGRVQRQAAVSACLELIREIEEYVFPATDGACWKRMHDMIRDTVSVFERRVRVSRGFHSTRELVFLASCEACIGALARGCRSREVDEAVMRAAGKALTLCCEVMERNIR